MTRMVFVVLATLIAANAARAQQPLAFIDCPQGYVQGGVNLCVQAVATGEKGTLYHYTDRRPTANKTIMEAQISCRNQGAHVCNYDEIYEAWDKIHGDLAVQEGLGNQGLDDLFLCINNPNDRMNFEGACHKHYKVRYRCCMSAPAALLPTF